MEDLLVIIVVTGIISLMAGSLFKEDTEVEDLYESMKPACRHDWSIDETRNVLSCLLCNKVAGK